MLPGPGFLLAASLSAVLAGLVALLIALIRGADPSRPRPPSRLEHKLREMLTPAVGARAAGGVVAALLALVSTGWPVAAVGVFALVLFWPSLFGGGRSEKVQMDRLSALIAWTESVRDTVAAGRALEQAVPAAAANAPAVIAEQMGRLVGRIRARVPLRAALLELAAELDDPGADLVIAALMLNVDRRGDRLGDVLSGLAKSAREELALRQKVAAERSVLRRAVRIIVGITVGFAVFLAVAAPAYVAPYSSAGGQVALTIVLALFAVGFSWLHKLAKPDVPAPLLARPGVATDAADAKLLSRMAAPGARGGGR